MEALTGRGALAHFRKLDDTTSAIQEQANVSVDELPNFVRSLQEKQKQLEKEVRQLKVKLATGGGSGGASASDETVDVGGVKLLAKRVDEISGGDLRNLADTFRAKMKSGVIVLGSVTDGKVTLLTVVTKDLMDRIPANTLIGKLAPIVGGKGGGKPDLAQAGGKDADRLDEALGMAAGALREMLAAGVAGAEA